MLFDLRRGLFGLRSGIQRLSTNLDTKARSVVTTATMIQLSLLSLSLHVPMQLLLYNRVLIPVSACPPSHGGHVAMCVFDVNPPSLPPPFSILFVSFSLFMALSTVFYFIRSSDNSSLSHSVLPVLFLPH